MSKLRGWYQQTVNGAVHFLWNGIALCGWHYVGPLGYLRSLHEIDPYDRKVCQACRLKRRYFSELREQARK